MNLTHRVIDICSGRKLFLHMLYLMFRIKYLEIMLKACEVTVCIDRDDAD